MSIRIWPWIVTGLLSTAIAAVPEPTYRDVVFATAPTDAGGTVLLRMNIYRPTGVIGPTPTVFWIHGGGWQSGTYNPVGAPALPMLDRGITLVSVEYRLSGTAIFPAQIHDVKAAVRFIRANAATYGIDPARLGAFGTSAGGHLVALLGTSGALPELEGTIGGNLGVSSCIQAAAPWFGPSDILTMTLDVTTPPGSTLNHDAATSPESKLIGFSAAGQGIGVLRANIDNPNPPYPAKVALANQVNTIRGVDPSDPPFFIAHGDQDTTVPLRQSLRLHDALAAAGVPATLRIVAGYGHGGFPAAVNNQVADWMAAQLAPRLTGDINHDNAVDVVDLLYLVDSWGRAAGDAGFDPRADFDFDNVVDVADLLHLAYNFGRSQ
jgi:acetyl esterase/lipase